MKKKTLNIQKPKIMASSPIAAATAAKSLQSCPTLCDPIDRSPAGSPVPDFPGKSTGVGCHCLLCLLIHKVNLLCPEGRIRIGSRIDDFYIIALGFS